MANNKRTRVPTMVTMRIPRETNAACAAFHIRALIERGLVKVER